MSDVALGAGALPASGILPGSARERTARRALATELVLFVALAAFASAQWARLVSDPPLTRLGMALVVVGAGAAGLGALRARRLRTGSALAPAVILALAMFAGALLAVGLPARLLAPGNWGELREGITTGLAGIEDVEMPYKGTDAWVRLTLMLGAGTLLAGAGALAFWPLRRRALGRMAALGALLLLYGTAVTLDSPAGEVLWGVPLLVLTGAWLWLPELPSGRIDVAGAILLGAGALALPFAAALGSERPWWDYESWDWVSRDRAVSFDWNHSYGPLEWPTEGTTLLEVRSERPLYWKATVLDRFDGLTWQRADPADDLAEAELRARTELRAPQALAERHPEWIEEAGFELRGLRSELVVGAGLPLSVDGADLSLAAPDGTLSTAGEPLESGAEYTVTSYAPNPTAAEMRRAPSTYPPRLAGSTLIGLPAGARGEASTASDGAAIPGQGPTPSGFAPSAAIAAPLWGEPPRGAAEALLASPYAPTYRLARRLTAGASTPAAAARAIEVHLRESYDYTQNVPEATYPLASFLFEDRAGYCQQFSGAMALMTRMVGIPSRVVSGFAPGSYDAEAGAYEVRDLDAHSWVEVYLRGLGWVTFDPTPAAAPAASQEVSASATSTVRRAGELPEEARSRARSLDRRLEGGQAAEVGRGGDDAWPAIGLGALITAAVAAGAFAFVYLGRRRRLRELGCAEEQTRELLAAVGRLGWPVGRGSTLLSIERRFEELARRRAIAAYARALGACRYAPRGGVPPGVAERRRLRRALGSGGGWRRRLRALRAVPPGGPAAREGRGR